MHFTLSIAALYLTSIISVVAEQWEDELPRLTDGDFAVRKKAQALIYTSVSSLQTRNKLEFAMYTLLEAYAATSDPEVQQRLLTLMKASSVPYKKALGRAEFGVTIRSKSETLHGKRSSFLLISGVKKGSPAAKAGIKVQDKIVMVHDKNLAQLGYALDAVFSDVIDGFAPGETVSLKIKRKEKILQIKVTLTKDTGRGLFSLFKAPHLTKEKQTDYATRKFAMKLPKKYDDGTFFARWFKRHQK